MKCEIFTVGELTLPFLYKRLIETRNSGPPSTDTRRTPQVVTLPSLKIKWLIDFLKLKHYF